MKRCRCLAGDVTADSDPRRGTVSRRNSLPSATTTREDLEGGVTDEGSSEAVRDELGRSDLYGERLLPTEFGNTCCIAGYEPFPCYAMRTFQLHRMCRGEYRVAVE